jgi:hypothetical protein
MKALHRISPSQLFLFLTCIYVSNASGQNVGIGTLTPTARIEVQSDNGVTVYGKNTGTGNAGLFEINNAASLSNTLGVKTNGMGYGLHVFNTGTNNAAYLQVINPLNTKSALYVATDGTGSGGEFHVTNPNNQNAGVFATSSGAGPAGSFDVNSGVSQATVLLVTSTGTGRGVHISLTNGSNNNAALFAKTTGTGSAGNFEIGSALNNSTALSALTVGTGSAGIIQVSNASSNAIALSANTNGLGKAGYFIVTNALNNGPALQALTNGPGYAGYFGNSSNAASTTHYGMAAFASGGGASSANVGGYFTASGATKNYAALFADGDVGIGTTGPNEKLEIASSDGRFITSDGNGINRRCILFVSPVSGTDYGRIEAFGYGSSGGGKVLAINNLGGGNVGIGTSTPDQQLSVSGGASKTGGGSWSTFSDKRMKKNIMQFADGLDVINQVNPVTFQYNGAGGYKEDGKQYVGVIAQDMQKIAPYMIEIKDKKLYESDKSTTALLMYDPSALTYILVNAVKEQQKMIEALEKKNLTINNGNIELEEKVASLSSQLSMLTTSLENIKQQIALVK